VASPAARLSVERFPGRPAENLEGILSLSVPSDLSLVESAVTCLTGAAFESGCPSERLRFRFRVALGEALTNAIASGNRLDRTKRVGVRVEVFAQHLRSSVSDEGPGFDPALVPDPRRPEAVREPRGRGLLLIREHVDRVEFNEKGNVIWMILSRS